jgi:hypothetical protein
MTQKQRTARIPNPVYAVAGAGTLAYRQLLELREEIPARVAGLQKDLAELQKEIPARVEQFRADVPTAVNSLVTGAVHAYGTLVAAGEKVVGRGRTVTAVVSTHTTPARPARKATATKAVNASAKRVPAKRAGATKTTAKRTRPAAK